jgi:fatty acid desaturase
VCNSKWSGCTWGAPSHRTHKGMPVLPPEARPDFLRRQVLTSRNISGDRLTSFLMGGLNYEIEHHLFPSMPRPNLRSAQRIVRPFCTANSV